MNKKNIMIIVLIILGIFISIKILTPNTTHTHKRTGNNDIDKAIVSIYKSNDFKEGSYNYDEELHEMSYEKAIALKLSYIERDDCSFYYISKYVEEYDVGEKLETRTVPFVDGSDEAEVEIYKIKDISDKVAVAVKTEHWRGYYLYVSVGYEPEDANEFIEAFGINKDTKVLYAEFDVYNKDCVIRYKEVTNNYFFENILTKAGDFNGFTSGTDELTGVEIALSISSLGEQMNIEIVENGDVCIRSVYIGRSYVFKSDEDGVSRVVDFVNYINDKYEGKITYYDR